MCVTVTTVDILEILFALGRGGVGGGVAGRSEFPLQKVRSDFFQKGKKYLMGGKKVLPPFDDF